MKVMKNIITILTLLIAFTVTSQSEMDSALISQINELRTNPKSFIPMVEKYISYQEKDIEMIKSGKLEVKVFSGSMNSDNTIDQNSTTSGIDVANKKIEAAKELINILDTLSPLSTLTFNKEMDSITNKQGEFLTSTGTKGHFGPNGQTPSDRFNTTKVTENVGSVSGFHLIKLNFKPMLVEMLVDAFQEDKGHRDNLLNPNAKFISVFVNEFVCIQNFSE